MLKKKKHKDNLPDYTFLTYVVRSVVYHLIVYVLRFLYEHVSQTYCHRAQWLSWKSVRLGILGLLVKVSPQAESLGCVLERDTLSAV